jgi:hypothetical protein
MLSGSSCSSTTSVEDEICLSEFDDEIAILKPKYVQNIYGRLDLLRRWNLPYDMMPSNNLRSRPKFASYASIGGQELRVSDVVELKTFDSSHCTDLLLIRSIKCYSCSPQPVIRGNIFRSSSLIIPTGSNDPAEVTLLAHVLSCNTQGKEMMEDAEVDICPEYIGLKRNLILTGTVSHRYRTLGATVAGELVCRSILVSYYYQKPVCKTQKPFEWVFRRLYKSEILPHDHRKNLQKRTKKRKHSQTSKPKPYTYISGFCGAGGEAEGARQAGANIVLAFDHDDTACSSISKNHPRTPVFRGDQWDIIHGQYAEVFKLKRGAIIHHLHLSPPCPYYSPAKTHAGMYDDENSAIMFCTGAYLDRFRPFIHTQEQTAGLFNRHAQCFSTIVSDIFEQGYNVRWNLTQCRDYGLAARRNRLFIIAAR